MPGEDDLGRDYVDWLIVFVPIGVLLLLLIAW